MDERSIVTFYEVQVERVYKGDGFRESTRLHLAFPGGRVEFGNGLAAEVKTVGLEPLALGQRYALFTKRLASDDRLLLSTSEQLVFRLALGSESIFHLLESGVIGPRTLETDLTVTYEGVSVHSFLQTLDKLWSGR